MKKSIIQYALKNHKGEYLKRSGGINNFQKGLDNAILWDEPFPKEKLEKGETMESITVTWDNSNDDDI